MKKFITLAASVGLFSSALFAGRPVVEGTVVTPIEGTLQSVSVHSAPPPALGIWSEIAVVFAVPCYGEFLGFQYSLNYLESGKLEIVGTAAITEFQSSEPLFTCMGMEMVEEVITVGGFLTEESVELRFVEEFVSQGFLPEESDGVVLNGDVTVLEVTRLCPEASPKNGVSCEADGSVITLGARMICVNSVAAFGYTVNRIGEGVVIDLAVYENLDPSRFVVRCAESFEDFQITLYDEYLSADDVVLNVIK